MCRTSCLHILDGMNTIPHASTPGYHGVRFYENDSSLAQIVADFIADGVARGEPAIVVATAVQRAAILRALVDKSVDVIELQKADDLILLDAATTLSTFMKDGKPNRNAFTHAMCEPIARACRGRQNCTVRIYGQMVDLLWQQGHKDEAIRLEIFWNSLADSHAFSLLCGYAIGNFYKGGQEEICRHHTHVVSPDGSSKAVA